MTRQILEHVQQDLDKITSNIKELDVLIDSNNPDESRKLEESIANRYTMESERRAYKKATGQGKQAVAEPVKEEDDDGITFL